MGSNEKFNKKSPRGGISLCRLDQFTAKNGYKELIYTPGNDVILTSRREYFESILVDGKEVLIEEDSEKFNVVVPTLINPVVKIRFKKGITRFSYCFLTSYLISIPGDLFSDNPEVTNFGYIFYTCSSLTSIPEDLFRYNPEATDFSACFYSCDSLTSIPENLFKYNTKITDFDNCFQDCKNLKTMPIDSDGTPIYNRSTLENLDIVL